MYGACILNACEEEEPWMQPLCEPLGMNCAPWPVDTVNDRHLAVELASSWELRALINTAGGRRVASDDGLWLGPLQRQGCRRVRHPPFYATVDFPHGLVQSWGARVGLGLGLGLGL